MLISTMATPICTHVPTDKACCRSAGPTLLSVLAALKEQITSQFQLIRVEALVRQLDRAKAMGLEIQVGAELEFYLLDPETGQPRDSGIRVYGLGRAARMNILSVQFASKSTNVVFRLNNPILSMPLDRSK